LFIEWQFFTFGSFIKEIEVLIVFFPSGASYNYIVKICIDLLQFITLNKFVLLRFGTQLTHWLPQTEDAYIDTIGPTLQKLYRDIHAQAKEFDDKLIVSLQYY